MRRYRSLSIVVSAIAVSALVGGFFGKNLLATDDKVPDHYKAFTAALSAIESSYIDKVDSDRLVYSAVRGMLSTLDPHSSFFDPREYAQMRERQEGHYYGIGIQISAVDGDIIAQFVFEGSPAYKQGVRQGDVIAKIAGEATKGWNTDQAMKKLRGARGTPVQIALKRRGYTDVIDVVLVRDEITIPTVPAYFMIDATTGYVQLRDFGENTDRDLRRALQDHDRAYLVGETTFGKALVQSIYRISGGAGLALTTAHYYTPSGRLIQRPWDATFDEYLTYTMRDQDANKPHNPGDLKRTDAGRPVYSGGGIEPDKRVAGPIEGFDPTRFGRSLQARGEFSIYAAKFSADGDARVTQASTGRKTVKPNFVVDDAMVADFREQMKTDRVRIDEDAYKKDFEFIKAMIRFEIDRALFGVAEARRHLIEVDPQARVALTMFGEAQKLSDLSRASSKAAH
jgi:hypothetical protein